MSEAVPPPPFWDGWWIMMRACGSAERFPVPAGGKEERAHAGGHPHADRVHRALQELHGVIYRHPCRNRAAGRVDVHVDVALWVVRVQEKQLRDDDVGDVVGHRRAEEDDAVHQEPREDVVSAFAARRALDDVGGVNRGHNYVRLNDFVLVHQPLNTFSSVILRSISLSRPAFSSAMYNSLGDILRLSACSAIRSSMSFSVAASFSRSARVSTSGRA